jgi:hypothetical protein
MTGIRISNRFTGWLPALLLAAPAASADDITLAAGNSRLSGEVRAIHADGAIELASPLAPQPLRLKNGAVRKVEFTALPSDAEAPGAIVELANGDRLPASVEALDGRTLTATSPHAGRVSIPRAALSSLQLGVREHKLVYSGPKNLDEWQGLDGPLKNLSIDGGALVANGQASAVRDIDLPRDFIIRFTLIWQERQMPNFQVYFADPLRPRGEASDRYYVQFNGAGIEIKREAEQGRRYNQIAALNRTPNLFPERELRVEVHVVRSTSRLKLFLNDEPEGEWEDPIGAIPKGGGIAIVSNASTGNIQRVSGIQILELDDSRTRHGAEDRGDGKQDSLISRDDDRWGGALTEIRSTASGPVFVFKSDFQNEPLEIPETDVSTVFFAKPAGEAGDGAAPAYRLRLRDGGSLQVSSCRFDGDSVTAGHPLLGELRLGRAGVLAFESVSAEKPEKPEP